MPIPTGPLVTIAGASLRDLWPVPDQRVLRNASATISVSVYDQDGTLADATGPLTVEIDRADGTNLYPAGTATTHAGTGVYTTTLTGIDTSQLDMLICTWTDPLGTTRTTHVEVVGGFYYSLAEARSSDPTLADTGKYSDAAILATRQEVENECETICDAAFVPRYRRVALDGTGTRELILPDHFIRTIRSVRVYTTPTTYTSASADVLAGIAYYSDNRVERTDFDVWTEGRNNIVVDYEYGLDRPAADLRRATLLRLRHRLNFTKSAVPDRASSFTSVEGGTYQLNRPTAYKTGIDEIDATYARYSQRTKDGDGNNAGPAGRRLDFDPQFYSLFHGGRR